MQINWILGHKPQHPQHLELCSFYGYASVIVFPLAKCWVLGVLPLITPIPFVIWKLNPLITFLRVVTT